MLDVQWHHKGDMFATCSADRSICVWEPDNNAQAHLQPFRVFNGHSDEINCVRWAVDQPILASSSDDKTVKVGFVASAAIVCCISRCGDSSGKWISQAQRLRHCMGTRTLCIPTIGAQLATQIGWHQAPKIRTFIYGTL